MTRRPVTYAHRRNKNVSSLHSLSPGSQRTSGSEKRRLSKLKIPQPTRKARFPTSATSNENSGLITKKLKVAVNPTTESSGAPFPFAQEPYELETPHPNLIAKQQTPRKESGLNRPTPDDLVPALDLPKERNAFNKQDQTSYCRSVTNSSTLKENSRFRLSKPGFSSPSSHGYRSGKMSYPEHIGQSMYLASPFTSKPSSLQFANKSVQRPAASSSKIFTSGALHKSKIPLQAQSANTSPRRSCMAGDITKDRRPSAPTATAERPSIMSWFSSSNPSMNTNVPLDIVSSLSDIGDFFVRGAPVDFNRPPSQLSYTSFYDEALFDEVLKVSTPSGGRKQRSTSELAQESLVDPDDDLFTFATSRSSDMILTPPLAFTKQNEFETWSSDSIISPPTLQVHAYSPPIVHMSPIDNSPSSQKALEVCQTPQLPSMSSVNVKENCLQELFHNLILGLDKPFHPVLRSRSLEDCTLLKVSEESSIKGKRGRDRSSTIRASDFAISGFSILGEGGPKRTRSGTIIQGPTQSRRGRSGTITAQPPADDSITLEEPDYSRNGDVEMADIKDGIQALNDGQIAACKYDDELLLKRHWRDEDWAVDGPAFPERRRRRLLPKKNDWRKRFELKKSSGMWDKVEDHDEGDGSDDPLLLK